MKSGKGNFSTLMIVTLISAVGYSCFFDVMIKPILLYGCELWGHENIEQTEVFHRKFFRRLLGVRKSTTKAITFGDLGQQELQFRRRQRKAFFGKNFLTMKNFCEFDVLANQFQRI